MRAVAFGAGVAAALGVVSVAAAGLENPDAPVTTARYVVAMDTQAITPDAPLPPTPDPTPSVEAAPGASQRSSLAFPVQPPAAAAPKRFDFAVDDARSGVDAVAGRLTGLATNVRLRQEAVTEIARFTTPVGRMVQDRNLRRGFGEMQAVGEKARLFLFAGDQGGVWTFNFTHDPGGVKAAGWTTERADQMGDRRIGFAWQKGRARIAVTGMERKFCQFGSELKDRVVAMSFSFSPGWSSHRDRQPS